MTIEELIKAAHCDSGRRFIYLDYAGKVTKLIDHLGEDMVEHYLEHYRKMFRNLLNEDIEDSDDNEK